MFRKYLQDINNIRFSIIYLFFAIIFIYLICVIYNIQIKKSGYYTQIKIEQNSSLPDINQNRGIIYATRKDGELVPLVDMEIWYKLVLIPKEVPQDYEGRLYEKINTVFKLDREIYNTRVAKKTNVYTELGIISPIDANKIEELNLVGIKTYKVNQRVYPMKEVGAKVIGFVGDGEGGMKGRAGLERYYNDVLAKQSSDKVSSFFNNLFSQVKSFDNGSTNLEDKKSENSSQDIITTLEPNVMKYTYEFLYNLQKDYGADTVAAVIMNTKTGEIIAMESLPTYDPNKYKDYENKNFINPIVQGVYELGSIFKPLTMVAAIENNLITPESTFMDTGQVKLDGYTIKNFDEKVRGLVTMQTVLGQSLNTGVVYLMRLIGRDRFRDALLKFAVEEETGIDLPGEVTNKTKNLYSKQDVDYATIAFGQGIAMSPISMLRALSSIPNKGMLVDPYIVKATKYKNGEIINISPENEVKMSTDEKTADTVKSMMIQVIDKDLARGKYKDNRYAVGAKTGTAQLTKDRGGYFEDKFLHSYFSFFGSEETPLAVLVFQVNPKGSGLASVILTPNVNKLKTFLINYYDIKPDRNLSNI
jgi:stage V sporulation protein D (sporulation-specific penicillin-binding protein)